MRIGYLGPPGTFSDEAARSAVDPERHELVGLTTIHDVVMGVQRGELQRGLVPIENALAGSVAATLDALVIDAEDVALVGEIVLPVVHCLIAAEERPLAGLRLVASHPHASEQCARFLRDALPAARVMAATSTAEAVRLVADGDGPDAAIGTRPAAERYGAAVLASGIEDVPGNETRFVWLAPAGGAARTGDGPERSEGERWTTSLVFWGTGDETPGWLVRCLSEFAFRGVNLTRIESRPRKRGLGHYVFFIDLEGAEGDAPVAAALGGLRAQAEHVRILGTWPLPAASERRRAG